MTNCCVCNCGGKKEEHFIGDPLCYRELFNGVIEQDRNDKNMYWLDGIRITEYTLKHQRGYSYHKEQGIWSSTKIKDSVNSITA